MTPARRRRWIRTVLTLLVVMVAGVIGRSYFLNQSLAAMLLGRPPGGAAPGTVLVYPARPIAGPGGQSAPSPTKETPLPPEAANPLSVSFETLSGWKHVPGKPFPDEVTQLDGRWISIAGYMPPMRQMQDITSFMIVRSLWSCCMGQTPQINHMIVVTMAPGKMVQFYPDPVIVTGKFSVGEEKEKNGTLVSVYRIEAVNVVVK